MQGKIYSGDVYVRKAGSTDGFSLLGNVTELSTKSDVDKKELTGTGRNNYGQAISSIVTPKPTEIEIKFNSFDKNALARALMGVAIDENGKVKSIEETAIIRQSDWMALGISDIDPAHFVLKNKAKQTIDASKYELNHRLGLVLLKDDSIQDDTLYFTAKTKGRSSFKIDAGTLHNLDLEIQLDGQDRITGKDGILHIPHATLSANGDINWFDDDWWEAGLTGTIVKKDKMPAMTFVQFD